MHFFPILSTLRRHRAASALIALEIALTCAIVCNAIFLISDRLSRMEHPSGVAEDELVVVRITGTGAQADASSLTTQDMVALRAIPGVRSAAASNMVPLGSSSSNTNVSTAPDDVHATSAGLYLGTADLLKTFGVKLIAGREFVPDEYMDLETALSNKIHIGSVIVTRDLAERWFPGKSALGQKLYVFGKEPQTIVGVIDQLARANDVARPNDVTAEVSAYSVVLPVTMNYANGAGNYMIRVDPTRRDEVLAAVAPTLDRVSASRIILDTQTFAEVRQGFFKSDRSMAYLLLGVSLALLIVTALGVVGLASFWVQQRTRQIGVRRALGATRGDILRYFQLENFILASIGILLGMVLAYAINLGLMHRYHVARLPAAYLPIGACLLWLLGQIAVLGPAMRAATIPPASATRTV